MDRELTTPTMPPDMHSERGAALIQVGIAIFVLVAMSAFVLDYGVMWMARRQAQNAADAGALAGAVARAYDETTDPPSANGVAFMSAMNAAQANKVFNQVGGIKVTWVCPAYAAGGRCVRVDVHRDGSDIDGNNTPDSTALPVFFATMFGLSSQPVRATATAWVGQGNSTECMRPFAVADKWNDIVDPTLTPPKFQRWNTQGQGAGSELSPKDVYVPPTVLSAGTGYRVPENVGDQVFLKTGNNPQSVADAVEPGWTLPVRLPDGNGGYVSGASDFNSAIKHCIGNPVTIGDYLPTENGVMTGPTNQGVQTDADSLVNQDANATWDIANKRVTGSCAPGCAEFSPRIVPVAVFDLDEFQWRTAANNWNTPWIPGVGPGTGTFNCPAGGRCVRVSNIIAFFVESMTSGDVTGRVVKYPGEFTTGPNVNSNAAFLTSIQLIR